MQAIRLRGKYAVGQHAYAIVDDADYEALNQYKWKAKPNRPGGNVYAIRTTKIGEKTCDIRMHRVVIGYSGRLDVDHINHNSLDNRKENLRTVTRSVNVLNRKPRHLVGTCVVCGLAYISMVNTPGRIYCSDECKPKVDYVPVVHAPIDCAHCCEPFTPVIDGQVYCGESCRKKAKYQRDAAAGKTRAAYLRQWRANRALENAKLPCGLSV
jgi:hypothetical protein